MIYFLFGPDTYRSRQKLREITTAFQEKAGGRIGLTHVDAAENPGAVFAAGRTASLFAAKELVIIENVSTVPAHAGTHISQQLDRWAEDRDVTIVFWEGDVAISTSPLVKNIQKRAAKSQEFKQLALAAVGRWLDAEVLRRGLKLASGEKQLLAQTYGADLWALSNELDKVQHGWPVRHEVLATTQVWDFTDAFLQHRRRAFLPLARLLEAGQDSVYILAALAGALRTLALVWRGLESGKLPSLTSRLHPFVVRKNTEIAGRTDGRMLSERFDELIGADIELKTGKLPPPLPLIKLILRRQ